MKATDNFKAEQQQRADKAIYVIFGMDACDALSNGIESLIKAIEDENVPYEIEVFNQGDVPYTTLMEKCCKYGAYSFLSEEEYKQLAI